MNDTAGGDITRDDVFHVLRNRRRRFTLHYLKRTDEPAEIGEVAEQVAAWEHETSPDAVTSQQRKRVYNSLQQTHLPQLDAKQIVEYESNRGRIRLDDQAEELDIYLEVVDDGDVPWSKYYTALSALGLALVAGAWVNVPPLNAVPNLAVAVFLSVAFGVSAATHIHFQRRGRLGDRSRPPELQERE